jgi:hypothetical protein
MCQSLILLGCFLFVFATSRGGPVLHDDNVAMRQVENARLRFLCRSEVCHVVTVYNACHSTDGVVIGAWRPWLAKWASQPVDRRAWISVSELNGQSGSGNNRVRT